MILPLLCTALVTQEAACPGSMPASSWASLRCAPSPPRRVCSPRTDLPPQLQHSANVSLSLPVAIAANGLQLASPGADGVQGLQTLTMTNAGGAQPGTTILQYAQTSDGQQILVPSNQVVVQSEYSWAWGETPVASTRVTF